MRDDFKVGDHVEWNSEAGMVTGTISKKITSASRCATRGYEDHHHSIVLPGEVLFRASYWYVSIQKLPCSSRLLSACGATPGLVPVLLERSAWECSGSMRKHKETCER